MTRLVDGRGRPRVVVTGMGAITPVGHTVAESWQSALEGRSGIGPITRFDASDYPCRIAGEVKGFEPKKYIDAREVRRMSRSSHLAVAAAQEALDDAGLADGLPDPERVGVLIGTGMGGFDRADETINTLRSRGLGRVSPFALSSSLPNMPTHHVSLMIGSLGPINTVIAACASGTQAIGEASELIRRGAADIVVAGGVEGLIHEGAIGGFGAMRALSTRFNDAPEQAMRPFDRDRDGFILSEGAGIMILERMETALARGAHIYAEVLGHASSSDAYHVAIPDPEAAGAIRAMRWALQDAAVAPQEVSYINAHGSSTPVNDALETLAVKQLFGETAYEIPVSSTKSVTGHMMGGTGAIEAIFCICAIEHETLPATWNYETPDPDCDLDYVPNAPRRVRVDVALNNSFGLGGQNACLVLGKWHANGTVNRHP